MIRKTLTILSLLGLLLSVGMWGVSYLWWFQFVPTQSGPDIYLGWGIIGLSGTGLPPPSQLPEDHSTWTAGTRYRSFDPDVVVYKTGWALNRIGAAIRPSFSPWIPRIMSDWPAEVSAIIPFWMPAILFALSLYFCHPLYYHRRRKRKKLGLCLMCGYDLRCSKDRCPECNTPKEVPKCTTAKV